MGSEVNIGTTRKITLFITATIIISIAIMNYELFWTVIYAREVQQGRVPFSKTSFITFLTANDMSEFLKSQDKASLERIFKVISVVFTGILSTMIVYLILGAKAQKKMNEYISKGMGPLKSDFRDLRKEEANYLTIIFTIVLVSRIFHKAIFNKKADITKIGIDVCWAFLCYFIIFPVSIFAVYLLFHKFGKNLIMGYYIAWLLFTMYEFSGVEPVDTVKMKIVNPKVFPSVVQTELKNYNLYDKVYQEVEPSKDKNAALVGFGEYRRIEIYGKFLEENEEGLYAVMLHEIGHAYDNSLLKKVIMYVVLIISEMIIFMLIYTKIAPKFHNNRISTFTAFMLFALIYLLFFKQWIFSCFKLVSQNAENNADKFAKNLGYGKPLGKVLYDIVIEAREYLAPTYLFNVFRSTHPPIDRRVNYLGE